ncbi:PQQ-dependent sugar dehydrogenase [Halomonas sp. B23F22_10]|uniref:PQQ-dependent sugar dehydrogenase n=1 Tax=Halomonas sp. B23F22_10 TaxID=3459515 RepID=UPI00373EB25D
MILPSRFPFACRLPSAALLGLLLSALAHAEPAPPRLVDTQRLAMCLTPLVGGLDHPWGLSQLPDGRLLVGERPGRLSRLEADGTLTRLAGGPARGLGPRPGRSARPGPASPLRRRRWRARLALLHLEPAGARRRRHRAVPGASRG